MASGGWLGEYFGHWGDGPRNPPPQPMGIGGWVGRYFAIVIQCVAELDQLSLTRACAPPPPQVGEEGSG